MHPGRLSECMYYVYETMVSTETIKVHIVYTRLFYISFSSLHEEYSALTTNRKDQRD